MNKFTNQGFQFVHKLSVVAFVTAFSLFTIYELICFFIFLFRALHR